MGAMHRGHTKCYGWRADCRGDDLEGLVRQRVRPELWSNFVSISGNICDLATARSTCNDVDYVLHHVALRKNY